MKKLIAMILVSIFMLSLTTGAAAADVDAVTAVTVSAAKSYTTATRTEAPDVVGAFDKLVASSAKSSAKAEEMKKLAYVVFELASGGEDVRTVYKGDDGSLYVNAGKKLRKIDDVSFYMLADSIGPGFYKLRSVPTATASYQNLAITESDYSFKKLDGKFYKSQFTKDAVPTLSLENGSFPTPSFSLKPLSATVTVVDESTGNGIFKGKLSELESFTPPKSGSYRVVISAAYDASYVKGWVNYAYKFSYSDEISFSVDGAGTNPGEVVILRAKNIPADAKISVTTDIQFTPNFFRQSNGDMIALLPISYYTAAGNHYVQLKCGDTVQKFAITAGNKQFPVQNLTVPPETAEETINSQKANDEYEKYIAPVRPVSDPKQYWKGRFIWPIKVERRVTTSFGTIRYTNGSKTASRHGAIDFAAAAGTPVYASGAGRVAYSGFLQLTGNTVVIEHGYGLKTWHYHMSSRAVKTGDIVTQGQKIGEVGSTGFSTGAHLHFGMSVNNVFVNPATAIETGLFAQ